MDRKFFEAIRQGLEKMQAEAKAASEDKPVDKAHYCATHVEHAEFGKGECITEEHAEPNEDGTIDWYTVQFEGMDPKVVMTSEMTVLQAENHCHSGKKKMKMEEVEQIAEAMSKEFEKKFAAEPKGVEVHMHHPKTDRVTKEKFFGTHSAVKAAAKHISDMQKLGWKVKEKKLIESEEEQVDEAMAKADVPAYLRKQKGEKPLTVADVKGPRKDSISSKEALAKLRNEEVGTVDESWQSSDADTFKHKEGGHIGLEKELYTGGKDSYRITHTVFKLNRKNPRSGGDFHATVLHTGTEKEMRKKYNDLKGSLQEELSESIKGAPAVASVTHGDYTITSHKPAFAKHGNTYHGPIETSRVNSDSASALKIPEDGGRTNVHVSVKNNKTGETTHHRVSLFKGEARINDYGRGADLKRPHAKSKEHAEVLKTHLAGDTVKEDLDLEDVETVEEAKSHTVPKTEKEKQLAALAEPKDKITHKDVMVGRGVAKEEVEYSEIVEKFDDFEIEVKESYTFSEYLNAAKHMVSEEEIVAAADKAYRNKDTDFVLEAFTRADIESKVDAHRKAGNKVTMPSFSTKKGEPYAEYTVTDKEGQARKYIHHGKTRKVETLG